MKKRSGFAIAILAGTIFCSPYVVLGSTSQDDGTVVKEDVNVDQKAGEAAAAPMAVESVQAVVPAEKEVPQTPPAAVESVGKTAAVAVVDEKDVAKERLLDTKKCYGCDLSGLDLSDLNLKNADLEKADLTGCNFSGAKFRKANLKGAILVNANLQNADLREADMYKADLSGSDLTGAKLKDAIFEDTYLSGVVGMVQAPVMLGPEKQ